jgi:methyl-accepting chemotaxis protein
MKNPTDSLFSIPIIPTFPKKGEHMWKNFKIRTRLFIGFAVLLVLFVIIAGFSILEMRSLAYLTSKLYDHPLAVNNAIREANTHIIKMHRSMKDVTLARDDDQLSAAIQAVNESEQAVYEKLAISKKKFLGEKELIDKLTLKFAGWKNVRDEVINLIREGKREEAAAITKGKGAQYVISLEKEMKYFIDFTSTKADEFLNNAKAQEQNSYFYFIGISILAIITAFFIAYSITNSITRPLTQAVNVANHLAKNDISIDVEKADTKDETGTLLRSMKEMLNSLRSQIRELTEGVNVLAGSAGEISAAAAQFASSFTEIASSINETVTSMKEVKQTSELSSDKAKYVADSSRDVVEVSRDGEKSVNETMIAMKSIQEQMVFIAESIVNLSEQIQFIGDIITVVDDIAEQSRLLAVNASIEAVKAGEQGKGFSVVAGEIKNLAQQSKESTRQVRSILTEIQKAAGNSVMVTEKGNKTVDSGAKQARQTGEAIRTLGQNLVEYSQAAAQIEATARQQLAGIDQVFSAMEGINSAISQNAEGARQLESAARNLEELGNTLKVIIQNYKI